MTGRFDLEAKRRQPWKTEEKLPSGITPGEILYGPDPAGPGGIGFQVATAILDNGKPAPTLGDLKALHRLRTGNGTTPTVVAVSNGTTAWLLGPSTEQVRDPLPRALAQRYLQSVLREPSTQAAYNRMISLSKSAETTGIAGVNNSGLFASYHLRENANHRADWPTATAAATSLLPKRGQQLIAALGFKSERATGGAQILSGTSGPPTAVAILLDESQQFDAASPLFNHLPPVAFGLRVAAERGIAWLVVLRDDQVRLYPGRDGVGVGQKGQTETFVELDLAALDTNYSALLPLIFSVDALGPDGTAQQLLDDSGKFASSLGERLRDRIYVEVIPPLAKATAEALSKNGHALNSDGLALSYRVTLHILFRLLFQAYAEDRGLLPSGRNERYDANSLKTAAQRDVNTDPDDFSQEGSELWFDLVQVWDAIDKGNKLWQVPAYNGGLFSCDPAVSGEGAALAMVTLPDSVIGPALQHLLVDDSEDGARGPVDFRSLSVREFGTIYEGLLESSLSVAETNLTVDRSGAWVPARDGDTVEASAGSVYFHSASGERKTTGSYFTPKIVVDHLVERSVTPALTAHLAKVADLLVAGEAVDAERLFFDFRVVDLAMGSGHFLVAAVDKVEALMRNFLTEHSIPGIQNELLRLAEVAKQALGDDEQAKVEVDNVALLRRQIARRCIYGLDINPMAVELARLAMWIHTFVPGLPMSNLDHGLVCANSLTGIGTVDEALDALQPGRVAGAMTIFEGVLGESLDSAKTLLVDMANAEEADKKQVAEAATMLVHARAAAQPALRIFDAAIAARLGRIDASALIGADDITPFAETGLLGEVHAELNPAHMPYLFPEVFLRDNPGFDVMLGNPPWEELHIAEHHWWGLRLPGMRSTPQAKRIPMLAEFRAARPELEQQYQNDIAQVERIRRAIAAGPYRGVGAAHLDLYQMFAWRNWQLLRGGGRSALVLPRGALSGASLAEWRKEILGAGSFADVCFLLNNMNWVFPEVHPQYTICLTVIEKGSDHAVRSCGPFAGAAAFRRGAQTLAEVPAEEFVTWSETAAFPLVPSTESANVFRQLMRSTPFGTSHADRDFALIQGDMNATKDRDVFEFDVDESRGRIAVTTGAGFNIWNPDAGLPYAYSPADVLRPYLEDKFARAVRTTRSAYYGMTPVEGVLQMDRARVAYRGIARATDTRTAIVCLLPPGRAVVDPAHLVVTKRGGPRDEAFLLGVMASIPFDWAARRWVELHLTFGVLTRLPVPWLGFDTRWGARARTVAGRLAAVDARYADWAHEVGVPVSSVKDRAEKDDLIAELDALASLLYGLSESQVEHIFATFHRGWDDSRPDYVARITAVRKHYAAWKGKA